MASSSNSSVQKSFKYDVFLSFRGEDTRRTFVDHLYHALQQKNIHTYKDDVTIKKGERISDELIKSIEDSRFFIIVFSKNYASSSWCLDELVKIMKCQKMTEHTAYPLFYDVEPTEVRKQSGEFGKAFAKYEREEAAEKWREALKEAAELAGWELKKTVDGHEAKFIQEVVEKISLELLSINFSVDGKLIGMETRIKDVVSSLKTCFDDVRMIGIKGMGGGGKTTLARAVFDQISNDQFEGTSFVENVREVSTASLSGLKKLQRQVLQDVLNDQGININSVHDGKKMMKRMMCCRKVLVVLDDVDHIEQLEALAGELNWFKKGSIIIITTRDEQVLVAHKVKLIHGVNLLSDAEAICFFSRYAFETEIPTPGYEKLSKQVVDYAAGLPLTIKILGSFLYGKKKLDWKDALERLKSIPLKETLKKLELSYNGLEEDYKEIFLDVACMLKGWKKGAAIIVLESCGFHARNGLRVLEQKSLITTSEYGELGMHDHIQEMGRNIVRRMHPDEPNKHNILWIDEEIEDILANDLGTEATRCMKLKIWKIHSTIVMEGLRNMKNLRCLLVDSRNSNHYGTEWELDEVSQYLPNALRYMRWENYPYLSLPKTFQANNLVALQMHSGKISQLWKGGERKVLNKLRFLDLSKSTVRTLDLGLTPNLEYLHLFECKKLVKIHIPDKGLKLVCLKVSGSIFRTLDLRLTPNLEVLYVQQYNYYYVELYMPAECCLKLEDLNLMCVKWMTPDLGRALNLETVKLVECVDLVELHLPLECPKLISFVISHSELRTLDLRGIPNLEKLCLANCHNLFELQMPVACLNLTTLDLNHSFLKTLNLGMTPNLINLDLGDSTLIRSLDLRQSPNLKSLNLRRCIQLAQVFVPVGGLKDLESVCLLQCFCFTNFKE